MNIYNIKSVLIIGMAGGLAQITAGLLAKKHPHLSITGVDSRDAGEISLGKNVEFRRMKYTRAGFERLFRDKKFDVVFHLGRMSHGGANAKAQLAQRLNLNVMGTSRILDLCLKFKVQKVLILSTFHVYGALVDNPVFIKEDAPLRASFKFPELRDVTEMDQIATNWMWKNQQNVEAIVLRPCNIIGPQIKNTISQYLTAKYAPVAMDFNPMFQFIHEFDMANIFIQCAEKVTTGIYNVAPEEVISLHEAKRHVGAPGLKVPITLLEPTARLIKALWSFPDYFIDYVKFASIIDSQEITKFLDKESFRFSTREALDLLKLD